MASHQKEIGKMHMFVIPSVTYHSGLLMIVLHIPFLSVSLLLPKLFLSFFIPQNSTDFAHPLYLFHRLAFYLPFCHNPRMVFCSCATCLYIWDAVLHLEMKSRLQPFHISSVHFQEHLGDWQSNGNQSYILLSPLKSIIKIAL